MKVLTVILLGLTLAFATSNVIKTDAKNDTSFRETKIVGGIATDIKYAPSQVMIMFVDIPICSGNIIHRYVVLTAAHCLVNKNILKLKIRSGSTFHNRNGRVVGVIGMKIHPNFSFCSNCGNFDIGLLFLADSAIAPGIHAATIALWDTNTFFPPGTVAILSGWGATKEGGGPSSELRSVALPVIHGSSCAHYGPHFADYNICAGFLPGGKDGCNGDSGAGLVILDKLAGVSSIGKGCGRENTPSGYVSVPAFRQWIWEEAHV